ncbi:MAG: DUF2079 domain-containing protein [Ruminococcaceae bacterium]|nr:DUF2079 domain-containing protein [Oscillospiraceae bacterium]
MEKNKLLSLSSIKSALSWERFICRIFAAWCTFAAVTTFGEGNFYDITFARDTSLGVMLLWIVLLFAAYSVVNVLLVHFETDTWFLMGAATVCVIRWLVKYTGTGNSLLFALAVAVAYVLFAVYFVNRNDALFASLKLKKGTVWATVIIIGIFSGAVIGVVTCLRYITFAAPNFDFGLFCNMFYHMKETGLPIVSSERDVLMSHFAVHLSPIYYVLLPFYFIFPTPLTLQIGQAVIIASGVIPVMLLCRHFKLSGKVTVVMSLIYALYPALSTGCFYDLHENCFLAPLLLWVFYFFERGNYPLMYVFAVLVLAVKEDAAVYIILFALYVIFARKKFAHGVILAVISAAYFVIALQILESVSASYAELYAGVSAKPAIAGPMVNRFDNLMASKEEGLGGAVKTALVNPGYLLTQLFTTSDGGWAKIVYVLEILLPLGFLPLCSKKPSRWLLVVPVLTNLLTMYKYQYDIGYQYHFGISAFLIYASIVNLPEMKSPARKTLLTVAAASCLCLYVVTVMPTVSSYVKRYEKGKDTYAKLEEVLETIPEDKSVVAPSMFVAHLANRDEIYALNYHGNEADVDIVVLDIRTKVDEKTLNAYLNAGYTVREEYPKLVMILERGESVE